MTSQRRTRAEVLARSRPLEAALDRWLVAFGRLAARQEIAKLGAVAKQDNDEEKLRDELRALLLKFGVRQAATAAQRAAGSVGGGLVIPGTLIADAIDGKPTRIKWFWEYRQGVIVRVNDIMETTRDEVRASVRRIVRDAEDEARTPSMGEIARRIHTQFHGVEADGRIRVFSPERGATIAQTELGQAENTGIFEGYKASGVEKKEWLARPGSERHGHMNGVIVAIDKPFITERGNRLMHPGDPNAPIGETANCECTLRAVVERRAKR